MNSMISWEQLLTFLLVFLFFYYAVILFFFYRKDLPVILKTGKNSGAGGAPIWSRTVPAEKKAEVANAGLYTLVHELMETLKPVFAAATSQSLEKQQVLEALQVRLQQYPQLKGTAFQIAVNNHIEQELQHRTGMILIEADMEALWQ